MYPRAFLVALEKRNFCLSRKLNPRFSVSEASTVPFSLSQFRAVGLRIILALQQSGRMKQLFRGILLLLLKKLQFWVAVGGGMCSRKRPIHSSVQLQRRRGQLKP
jgi:hypothetical protein